jgi:hypothetical protein
MDQHRTAVAAHTLLGSVSIVIAAAERLAGDWDGPRDEAQEALLLDLSEHATHIKSVLHALVRGLPHDAYTH